MMGIGVHVFLGCFGGGVFGISFHSQMVMPMIMCLRYDDYDQLRVKYIRAAVTKHGQGLTRNLRRMDLNRRWIKANNLFLNLTLNISSQKLSTNPTPHSPSRWEGLE